MDRELLAQYGETIAYALVGVLGLVGLVVVQLVRRRRDVKRARLAVHLVTLSLSEPRPGPIAVRGTHRATSGERWLECSGQRVAVDGSVDIVRGTGARWSGGKRTYSLRDRDEVIAIGVMTKQGDGAWSLAASPGESGVQLFAAKPRPAPPPLWPWRGLIALAICGGLAFGALYAAGTFVVDVPRGEHPCSETTLWRLDIAAALPLSRDDAMRGLARCAK